MKYTIFMFCALAGVSYAEGNTLRIGKVTYGEIKVVSPSYQLNLPATTVSLYDSIIIGGMWKCRNFSDLTYCEPINKQKKHK